MSKYPPALQQLMTMLKQLPGVGAKTAERFAFQLLTWSDENLSQFSSAVRELKHEVPLCPTCHCLSSHAGCYFCNLSKREASFLCVVGSVKEVYAIEETHAYQGLYHVLGSLISPLDGRTIQQLNLTSLLNRLCQHSVQEVIIALDSTLEGDATALYLKEKIQTLNIRVSRLAFGLPMGSPLEYVDGGTLSRAFMGRQLF
ncbi:MAG: recombination mediator RecR [Candidatus Rhabdochlamydia sp.]